MRYFRVAGREAQVNDGGADVMMLMPETGEGEEFQILHRFGDERGMIIAAQQQPEGVYEELAESDGVVASQIAWFDGNPGDAPGLFVLRGGLYAAAGVR